MNWDQVEGKWTEYKGRVQQQWGELSDDDIDRVNGSKGELEGLLQQRYGQSREDARKAVDNWLGSA